MDAEQSPFTPGTVVAVCTYPRWPSRDMPERSLRRRVVHKVHKDGCFTLRMTDGPSGEPGEVLPKVWRPLRESQGYGPDQSGWVWLARGRGKARWDNEGHLELWTEAHDAERARAGAARDNLQLREAVTKAAAQLSPLEDAEKIAALAAVLGIEPASAGSQD